MKMKITIVLLLLVNFAKAQKIAYDYSGSGNRTMRKYDATAFRVGNLDSTSSSKIFSTVLMQNGLSFYPNPSTDRVVFTINDYTYSVKSSIAILDQTGKEIKSLNVTSNKTEMDVSSLPEGLYIVKLVKNEVVLYYKLLKVR